MTFQARIAADSQLQELVGGTVFAMVRLRLTTALPVTMSLHDAVNQHDTGCWV